MAYYTPTSREGWGGADYSIVRETFVDADVDSNAAVDSAQANYQFWTQGKLLAARVRLTGAGTATTAGWTIKNGTSSIGALVVGTNTAGTWVDVATFGTAAVSSGGTINFTNITSDTALTGDLYLIWERVYNTTE